MYIVFEGIDGSGKTTLSTKVAEAIQERGLRVYQTRMKSGFATPLAGVLREVGRDVRHLAMTPRVETLLGAAREAELLDQVVRPHIEDGEIVIADRSLYTTLVQAVWARGMDRATVEGMLALAGAGLRPDLVVYCDVDAPTSRLRRRIQKIKDKRTRDAGRKGMSGLQLREKMREGYLALAAEDPQRWTVLDNVKMGLDQAFETALSFVGARLGIDVPSPRPRPAPPSPPSAPSVLETLPAWFYGRVAEIARQDTALSAFLLLGLDAPEAHQLRADLADIEPAIVAYSVGGLDSDDSMRLRYRLATRVPSVVADSIAGYEDEASWDLRKSLARKAPEEVAAGLRGIDTRAANSLREALAELSPEGVLEGLGGLDTRFSWEMREALGRASETALARSLRGLDHDRSWDIRASLEREVPAAVLQSVSGLESDRAWALRARWVARAPKLVLRTIEGMDGEPAWKMRQEAAALGKELLDSIRGLDEERAWMLRERHRATWPHTAVGSVGKLAFTPRGEAFVRRELAAHPTRVMVARKAVAVLEKAAERIARWGSIA